MNLLASRSILAVALATASVAHAGSPPEQVCRMEVVDAISGQQALVCRLRVTDEDGKVIEFELTGLQGDVGAIGVAL